MFVKHLKGKNKNLNVNNFHISFFLKITYFFYSSVSRKGNLQNIHIIPPFFNIIGQFRPVVNRSI